MSIFLAMAAAGATYISGPITIDAQEIKNHGIEITVRNFNRELTFDTGPLFFEIDLLSFRTCKVRDLGLRVVDSSETEIFGAILAASDRRSYSFRLSEHHIESTTIAISCDSNPDRANQVYTFNLGEAIKAP